MLVLSRKENESIIIEGHIKVTVMEIRGDKIRLGIDAPRDVAVWREELERRARNERRELAGV
jgi:carbon storage regulator